MLIDSHCHLHDSEFFTTEQAEACLERARTVGVEKIICIGTSHEDSLAARDFANSHDGVYWTYGIHPESAGCLPDVPFPERTFSPEMSYTGTPAEPPAAQANLLGPSGIYISGLENLKMFLEKTSSDSRLTNLVGIGEVGLDYHYERYDREKQIRLFEQMLQLATDNDLPVSFHIREAFADFFPVVANFPRLRGVVHSFTDSKKVLKRILNETDFMVGVNGLATYSTLPLPPLERILLETDAPFLAPVPHRGETNEPAHIADIAEWLAGRLEVSMQSIEEKTTENVNDLFQLNYN